MSSALEIETAFRHLSHAEQDALLERLAEIWEESLKVSDEFKARIDRGMTDIAEGRYRVRYPKA